MRTLSARVTKSESKGTKSEPKDTKREPKGSQKGPTWSQKGAKKRPKCIQKSIFGKGRFYDRKCVPAREFLGPILGPKITKNR